MDKQIVEIKNISLKNHPAVTALKLYEKGYINEHTQAAGSFYFKGFNFCSDLFEFEDDAWQWLKDNAASTSTPEGHNHVPSGLLEQDFHWTESQ